MPTPHLLLLIVVCIGLPLAIGWLFSNAQTRPVMNVAGQLLRALANIVR